MPVLSESPNTQEPCLPGTSTTMYIYVGAVMVLCVGVLIKHHSKPWAVQVSSLISAPAEKTQDPAQAQALLYLDEKALLPEVEVPKEQPSQTSTVALNLPLPDHIRPFIPGREPPPDFPPPRALTHPLNLSIPPLYPHAQPLSFTNMSFTQSPISISPNPTPYFPSNKSSNNDYYYNTPTSSLDREEMPPRRRSYTRNTLTGTEVSGEIIVAEGWRRHTRVFGGGVCKACEESESARRGSA